MDVETAKAIKGLADTLIESAKAETKAIELLGDSGASTFLGTNRDALPAPSSGSGGRRP